jgi:hypothetical protein
VVPPGDPPIDRLQGQVQINGVDLYTENIGTF